MSGQAVGIQTGHDLRIHFRCEFQTRHDTRRLAELPSGPTRPRKLTAFNLCWRAAAAAALLLLPLAVHASGGSSPTITCISPVSPFGNQTITVSGSGFGTQGAYSGTSQFIRITDRTAGWSAGYTGEWVTLTVSSWVDTSIIITGFSGSYGSGSWVLTPGDEILVSVWNANSGAGPATYDVIVSAEAAAAGGLDTSFGSNGTTLFPVGYAVLEGGANAATIDAVGNIVIAGGGNTASVARLTSSGILDTSFGTNGITKITAGNSGCSNCSVAEALAVDSQG